MNPVEAVTLLARSQLWVRESGGENRGQVVEHYLSSVGQPAGEPWCAAFVSWVGKLGVAGWPLPMTAGCQALFNAASKLQLIDTVPSPGAVFLLWRPALGRFAHTGFVLSRAAAGWQTIEGNTNPAGGREGYGVFERKRLFAPEDRFIRWSH